MVYSKSEIVGSLIELNLARIPLHETAEPGVQLLRQCPRGSVPERLGRGGGGEGLHLSAQLPLRERQQSNGAVPVRHVPGDHVLRRKTTLAQERMSCKKECSSRDVLV